MYCTGWSKSKQTGAVTFGRRIGYKNVVQKLNSLSVAYLTSVNYSGLSLSVPPREPAKWPT